VTDAISEFAKRTCTAPSERSDRLRDIVLRHVPHDRPRVLDAGCGTGSLVRRLGEALPAATIVGIDLSPANIEAASQQAPRLDPVRIRFVVADYLDYREGPFDVVVSDGVLHLIPGRSAALAEKIASDLVPGGVFICGMPYDSVYNRAFAVIRRMLRAIRSGATDRLILAIARWWHRGEMDDRHLRERVAYMYFVPERMMGRALVACFERAGLRRTAVYPMRSTSPSQLRHNVTVWTRAPAA
jgi:SAM-dependent methyltransferase